MSASSSDFVVLRSMDGYSFSVPRHIACASGTLRMMLDEEESTSNECKLQLRGVILLKVIEYLAYKVQYANTNAADIKEDFADRIDPYIALELLTAADFLDT